MYGCELAIKDLSGDYNGLTWSGQGLVMADNKEAISTYHTHTQMTFDTLSFLMA